MEGLLSTGPTPSSFGPITAHPDCWMTCMILRPVLVVLYKKKKKDLIHSQNLRYFVLAVIPELVPAPLDSDHSDSTFLGRTLKFRLRLMFRIQVQELN